MPSARWSESVRGLLSRTGRRIAKPSAYALVAGGGTGGHVYPALAIADALVARGHTKSTVAFVGSRRALEAKVVPAAGYRITLLSGRGIQRRLTLASAWAVVGLVGATAQALILVARSRPKVVVSVGGYAAAPAALAAVVLRVPLVLAESNAVPGAVHRLVGRFARVSAVAWAHTPLPRAIVTGNPVRPAIAHLDRSTAARAAARSTLGLPEDRIVVAAFGGSLGAGSINRAMTELVRAHWSKRGDLVVHHVVGRRDWPEQSLRSLAGDGVRYIAVEYEERMDALLAAADVMVSRSGGITSAEVAAAGIPAVFVPLPNAPGDHQTANARAFERIGAAVVMADAECTADRLDDALRSLLDDEAVRITMGEAARTLAHPDAAERVAELVERAARGEEFSAIG